MANKQLDNLEPENPRSNEEKQRTEQVRTGQDRAEPDKQNLGTPGSAGERQWLDEEDDEL